MTEAGRCSRCSAPPVWLVTVRYEDHDVAGRLLTYCDRCRIRLGERIAVAIPLSVVELAPDATTVTLYEQGFTRTDPGMASEILNLSSDRWVSRLQGPACREEGGSFTWEGALDRSDFDDQYVADRDSLADAARAGDWTMVLELLRGGRSLVPNHWRLGGESWFTPLHQAAWHGAPVAVVQELVRLGASRGQPAADGRAAYQIALDQGHVGVADAFLPPRSPLLSSRAVGMSLERNLARLVESRIRPHSTARLRPLPIGVITEAPRGKIVWYPVPGMNGGFAVRLERSHLVVDSWFQVFGGAGQSHVVTEDGYQLTAE